jgi:N-acetylglucosaminyl-diphospho-decaprenol L-rhamnosyltransferase
LPSQISNSVLLSIVIVNFRTPEFVINCLATLLPELDDLDARVAIVDNNSDDNSNEIINNWIDEYDAGRMVLLVQSSANAGFSSGNNIGINAQKARYYMLLNSDTLIRPGAIRVILDAAEASPRAGLVSPRLEWPDGTPQESCFRFHTPLGEFLRAAQTGLIDRLLCKFVVPLPVQSELTNPKWTSFACVLIRDEVIQQVGLMDEQYFLYFEDVEFCFRARKAGWDIVNQPNASVVHLRGGSSPVKMNAMQKKRLPRYYYESRTLYFYQTTGWAGLFVANLLWEAGRLISKTRQLLGRPDKAAIEHQWIDIWINWLTPLAVHTRPGADK